MNSKFLSLKNSSRLSLEIIDNPEQLSNCEEKKRYFQDKQSKDLIIQLFGSSLFTDIKDKIRITIKIRTAKTQNGKTEDPN